MIYLDHSATTPIHNDVLEAMQPYLTKYFANAASSHHQLGLESKVAVDQARNKIADLIGSDDPESILFTSGTTESNNFVLKNFNGKTDHIITQKTEHASVLDTIKYLKTIGVNVTCLDVDEFGFVNPIDLKNALTPQTKLVSIMYANNEIGTIQNIRELSKVAHQQKGICFHTDAAQAVGKIPVNILADDIDFMSFSAHKIYGPKGIGALYIGKRVRKSSLVPLIHGGGHEFGLRSGTLNVAGIVGFAKALQICEESKNLEGKRQSEMRDGFIKDITNSVKHVSLNGHPERRLPNNINLSFDGVDSGELMSHLPEYALSSGSACSSATTEPSYVIKALGKTNSQAKSSIRISLGYSTQKSELKKISTDLEKAIGKLRENSLEYEMLLKRHKTT